MKKFLVHLFLAVPVLAAPLPKARVYEGLWSDYFRIEPALHTTGIMATRLTVNEIPREEPSWNPYSVIVLANVDVLAFKEPRLTRLKEFVANGGGLVVLGGECAFTRGGYTNTPLAELLPVDFPFMHMIPRYLDGLALTRAPGATWLPTVTGSAAAFYVQTLVPKPGATVQMLAGDKPAIISGNYGKGRVVAVALTAMGEPPAGKTAFWDWPDWPRVLGAAIDWAAGNAQPSDAVSALKPLTAEELGDFGMGMKTPENLVKRALAYPSADVAQTLFTAPDSKFSLAQVLPALLPFAKPDWGPKLLDRTGALNPNKEDRQAAWVLLGASKWPGGVQPLVAALGDAETRVVALDGLGLAGDASVIPHVRKAYEAALNAARLPGETDRFDPDSFGMTHAGVASAAAVALYRLGDATALERILYLHRHVKLYLRVYNNAGRRELRNWADPVGQAFLKNCYEHADRLQVAFAKLRVRREPIPASQVPVFLKIAAAATDYDDADWLALEMERSPDVNWQPLANAKDGTIARLARSAGTK